MKWVQETSRTTQDFLFMFFMLMKLLKAMRSFFCLFFYPENNFSTKNPLLFDWLKGPAPYQFESFKCIPHNNF